MRRIVLFVLVLCAPARAQVKAVELASAPELSRTDGHIGVGVDLAFGWAGQRNGPRGWSARLDYELLPFFDPGKLGGLVGVMPGVEIWSSGEDNWGFSLPLGVVGGVRLFPLRAVAGVGVDAILVDQVDDDTGFGMYAPFAMAKLGIDVFGAQLGVDARIGYRWQLGADDHTRWQLGCFVGYTAAPPNRGFR